MSYKLLVYSVEQGVAHIMLNDPARLNALSLVLQEELLDALANVRADTAVRALLLTATGKAFCVGADLSNLGQVGEGDTVGSQTERKMLELTNPLIEQLHNLAVPVVSAIGGVAAGAGVGIALSADIVLAARSAYFYLPFIPKFGIIPDAGSTWYLAHLLGRARATALTLLGERLPADRAEQWGLIAACVDDDALAPQAFQIAQRLAALPAHGVLETRRAFDAAQRNDLPAQLRYEASRQRELLDLDSLQEGIRAFFEKRPPNFRGR